VAVGYIFKAVGQRAISAQVDGANLPAPRIGTWHFETTVPDVAMPQSRFDHPAFKLKGYHIWPFPKP